MEITANKILTDAANLLSTKDNVGRGAFFKKDRLSKNNCLMCAHGAIMYCGDAEIKQRIDSKKYDANEIALDRVDGARELACKLSGKNNWFKRKAKKEKLSIPKYITKHYGQVGLAHYKAFKAVLSFDYNDLSTKQQVLDKLLKAAGSS